MNKLESRYAEELKLQQIGGQILWWEFEAMKFKLADKTYYTPDFIVMDSNLEISIREVKGHWEDDARVKIKCAAAKFPIFRFMAIKNNRGLWEVEEF